MGPEAYPDRNIPEEIWRTLYESDKRVMSAQDVADEIDDVSRQYTSRKLNQMAENSRDIERVEIGPSVGYYWDRDPLDDLGRQFNGHSLLRATSGRPISVPCSECETQLEAGDDVVVLYERHGSEWERVEMHCPDCLSDIREDELLESLLAESYIADALEDVNMAFMCVRGTLEEYSFVDGDTSRELSTYVLDEVDVLQMVRSREFELGPEFSTDLE